MRLADRFRSALVTGAGSGLGAAFADHLLAAGLRVWGTSRTPTRLVHRENFFPLPLELTADESIDAAWTEAERAAGGIDLLVNNAGSGVFGPVAAVSSEQREREVRVLLHGPVRLSGLAWPRMRERGGGAIVNVTSLAVEMPVPFLDGYCAGKAALASFTEALVFEARGSGVAVLDFRPGDYRTNFNEAMRAGASDARREPRAARVWARLEQITAHAPPPERAARDLLRALRAGRSGVVRSGGFFQVRVARWGNHLLPARMMRWLRAFYFRIGS